MNRVKQFLLGGISLFSFAMAAERAVALHHASTPAQAGLDYSGLVAMLICGAIAGWACLYKWYVS